MTATVIIPFHRNLSQLAQSLPAARRSMPDAEVIVAADGAVDDCHALAQAWGARVIDIAGPSGPAAARNRAAAVARGQILVFVDADVVVSPDAIPGMIRLLEAEPDVAAVFGAYDETPTAPNFMSQYKNLSHSYVHQAGNKEAATFWAGLGAIRANAFRAVGGFDERFRRPSIEDIEMGYRLTRENHRLRLDPRFRGCHLKRWTLAGSIVTDISARGIPWTQVLRKFNAFQNDLNLRTGLRLSILCSYALLASVAALTVTPWAALGVAGALIALAILNYPYYRWFVRERGVAFGVRVFFAHIVHHLCNGVSFIVGTTLFLAARLGIDLPGAVPQAVWTPALAARIHSTLSPSKL